MLCKLISSNILIPNQQLDEGQTLIIGRNRQCKIKDLKCSRNFLKIYFKNKKLHVEYLKNGKSDSFKSGEFIKGPGFSYKIIFVSNNDQKRSNPNEDIIWSEYDSGKVIVGSFLGGGKQSNRIAGFDFDFTLICTMSQKKFPIDENDWVLFDPQLPRYINQIVQQGYRFLVFSNQLGVSKGKANIDMIKNRFNNSIKKINVPCLLFIATHDDIYRKPRIGLWDYFLKQFQPNVKINMKESFYVGDAAGRPKGPNQKADFSDSDLLFALNSGLNFLFPEKFIEIMTKNSSFNYQFKNQHLPMPIKAFKFHDEGKSDFILENRITGKKISNLEVILPSSDPHCIIFCGISGSGKTTFYENYLKNLNYIHISLDILKTKQKCLTLAKKSFAEKKNCIIDNTNIDKSSRMNWINLCKQNNFKPIIFYFDLPLKHILHNNKFRQLTNINKSVTDVIIYTQNKKFEPLSSSECSYQFTVNFIPKFSDTNYEKLYSMYLN